MVVVFPNKGYVPTLKLYFVFIILLFSVLFGTVPNSTLQSAIFGFYEADKIYETKRILNDIASRNIKDTPTHGRRQGDGRKRECEDLLNIFETLDIAKCDLPKFVVLVLNIVPILKMSDADVWVIVSKVSYLTEVVEQLR